MPHGVNRDSLVPQRPTVAELVRDPGDAPLVGGRETVDRVDRVVPVVPVGAAHIRDQVVPVGNGEGHGVAVVPQLAQPAPAGPVPGFGAHEVPVGNGGGQGGVEIGVAVVPQLAEPAPNFGAVVPQLSQSVALEVPDIDLTEMDEDPDGIPQVPDGIGR